MLSPTQLYPLVEAWLVALGVAPHRAARAALATLVTALLTAQSLRPAALMRALCSPQPVPARQRYKRVARAFERPWLTSAHLTPLLVRAAVALAPPAPADGRPGAGLTHLALDGVRCGPWEILVLGVVWHKRVLPVGWAVLPYPWPKKQFTPTACALVRQVAAAWPAARPVHLVADRGFPSRPLFQALRAAGWGWTLRLGARSLVTVAGQPRWARELLAGARVGRWTVYPGATYGSAAPAVAGALVVGRGLPVVPWHQRGGGCQRQRAAQQAARRAYLARKHRRRGGDAAAETDAWVILFTTHPTARAAQTSYWQRWAIEGSFRDAQGGWDGRHGWDLEPTAAQAPAAGRVEALVGLWALATLLQTWLGHATRAMACPGEVQAVAREWTTSGRLSLWARGQLALADRSGRLTAWAGETLTAGSRRLLPAAAPPPLTLPPRRPGESAADPIRLAA